MTSLQPRPDPTGEWGFDYLEWGYPAAAVSVRFDCTTGTYPPRHILSPHERSVLAQVANDTWRRTVRFEDPVISALEGQHAAVHGQTEVIDQVARTTLGIEQVGRGYWREAVSTALLGDWVHLIGDDNASIAVPRYLKGQAKCIHKQCQPLWERKVNDRRLDLLETPIAAGLTLGDLISDDHERDQCVRSTAIDEPRVQAVLGALDPDERDVALAWARDPAVRTWAEAARATGNPRPEEFGERVRRKLKRLGARHTKRAAAAQSTRHDRQAFTV